MSTRNYSNIATPNALSGSINNTDVTTTASLQSTLSGWPASTPYLAVLERGTAAEEVVLVTAVSGASVTFTRGYDGTTKVSHGNLAPFEHCATAIDYREANTHVNASQNVHGLNPGSAVVGATDAQTLTNKTLTQPAINDFSQAHHDHSSSAQGGNIPETSVTGLVADLAAKANSTDLTALSTTVSTNDGNAVHKSGAETIGGNKTLTGATAVAAVTASGLATLNGGLALTANANNNVPTTPGATNLKLIALTVPFTMTASASASVGATFTGLTTLIAATLTVAVGSNFRVDADWNGSPTQAGGTILVRESENTAITASGTVHIIAIGT